MKNLKLFILIGLIILPSIVLAEEILSLEQKEVKMNQSYKSEDFSRFQNWAYSILSIEPKHLDALYKLGVYHLGKNQLGVARLLFEKAIQHHSNEPSLYYQQGLIAFKENEKQKAILAFEKSLTVDSNYTPAAIALSSLYMESLNVQKALPFLNRFYKKSQPSKYFAPLAHNYALALRLSGDAKGARKVYQSIVNKKKEDALILMNYALLLIESFNDKKEAQKLLDRASIIARSSKQRTRVRVLKNKINKMR